jgi:signal transduction histidine kinase
MAYFWLQPAALLCRPFKRLVKGRIIDPRSLQTRLTVGVVLTSLIGVGVVTVWVSWRTQEIMLDSHRQRAALVAERLQEDVRYYSKTMPSQAALVKVVDHRSTGDLAIWVDSPEGERLAQSETLTMGSWQTSGVSEALLSTPMPMGTDIISVQGWRLAVCSTSLELAGRPPATLYIANDITAAYQGLQRLLRMLLLTSLGLISLLAMAFALYIRRTLSPIRQLNRLAGQVTADTLDQPLTLAVAPTELQELVRTYNLMLARLDKAWGQQKRLVNDVSHELRTPLSLVQGYLESTLHRGHNLTEPQREGLEIAAAEARRTTRLLTQMLDLARLNNGQETLFLEPAQLEDIVHRAVVALTTTSPQAGDRLQVAIEAPAVARVDAQKLSLALAELIDNALRYSDPQQPVQIALSTQAPWATIQVKDQGIGIPDACQENIFDPFYRVDAARSRCSGGTGLGLTLTRSLVEAMGGQVSVQSQPGQGSVFTLHLPIQPHPSTHPPTHP